MLGRSIVKGSRKTWFSQCFATCSYLMEAFLRCVNSGCPWDFSTSENFSSYSFIASSPTPRNYTRRLEIFNENFRYSCSNFWETRPLISCCFWSFLLGDYIPVRAYILLISSWGCDSILFLDSLEVMSDQQVGFLASWFGSHASEIKSRVWFL